MCFVIFWQKQLLMSFFIQDLHLTFHSLLGFQHGSGMSVKAILPLSAILPFVINLKCFWFLIALLLYQKSTILGLSFFNPKDLCLSTSFQRGSWQKHSVSTYVTYVKKKLGSFNDLINDYFQSFIRLPQYEHFLVSIFCKVSLALLNRIQPILKKLKENITKP